MLEDLSEWEKVWKSESRDFEWYWQGHSGGQCVLVGNMWMEVDSRYGVTFYVFASSM